MKTDSQSNSNQNLLRVPWFVSFCSR